ncbi:MAG: hypothetical protein KF770_09635 [Anaerolineae bacterium]|nr:hypothetical protein [Anaerolineae bacterium]
MAPRTFSESEKNALKHSVNRWLTESQRWKDEFETLLPKPMVDYPSDTDSLVISATYFLIAAGCTYYHCQTLLEAKLGGRNEAKKELEKYRKRYPAIQSLLDRRDWLNHGAINRKPDFQLVFAMVKGPDKTFEEALSEIKHKDRVTIKQSVRLLWGDKDELSTDEILHWQQVVISELKKMIEEIGYNS